MRQRNCHCFIANPILLRINSSWDHWKWNTAFSLCIREDDEDWVKGGSTSATARALGFRNLLWPLGLVTLSHPVFPLVFVTISLQWWMYQDCAGIFYCCYPTRKISYHTRSTWQPQRQFLWQPTETSAVHHSPFPVLSKQKQKKLWFFTAKLSEKINTMVLYKNVQSYLTMYKKIWKIKTNRDDLIQCGYSRQKSRLMPLPQCKYKMDNNWSSSFLCYCTVHS